MSSLTLTIDEELLRRARIRALEQAIVERMTRLHCVPVDADLVLRALRAGQRWQLPHWDALMVAAAQQSGCDRLLTEDLADGAVYDGLRIENPFAGKAG